MKLLHRAYVDLSLATILTAIGYELTMWLTHGRHASVVMLIFCATSGVVYFGLVRWLTPRKSQLQLLLKINGFQVWGWAAEKDDVTLGNMVFRFVIGCCLMATIGMLLDAWGQSRRENRPVTDQPANSSK